MTIWSPARSVKKLVGADVELGNFILGVVRPDGTGTDASRALLREIDGLPPAAPQYDPVASGYASAYGYPAVWGQGHDLQDWGRKFLPANGGCAYIDLNHLEICLSEVVSAFDYVAAWHAMLRIARAAQCAANARLPAAQKLQVHVNNSDGLSNSYGGHLNVLVTRRAWDNIFRRRLHYQLFLAAFQASSIVYTGQGKVGSENGAPRVAYQIAQRADFIETLTGEQTTYHRPLVNSRDESLCGKRRDLARLHCIFFDSTLSHVATLLKVGCMQMVLAMIERGEVDLSLLLEDPVDAVVRWSHDPSLRARGRLLSGEQVTAVELQLRFLEHAARFVESGACDGSVPRAAEILSLWKDTLFKLHAGDFDALAGRLDWVLKFRAIRRVLKRRRDLTWHSPEIKHLDHLYSSLDPDEGLYWHFERNGVTEPVVDEDRIAHLTANSVEDTRAWTRALLLRLAGPTRVASVDWDHITVDPDPSGFSGRRLRVDLPDPLGFTRADVERRLGPQPTLEHALVALGAYEVTSNTPNAGWPPILGPHPVQPRSVRPARMTRGNGSTQLDKEKE